MIQGAFYTGTYPKLFANIGIPMFTFLIILAFTVSGCSLAPKEEVLPEAPVIQTSTEKDYQLVEVLRGDIIESLSVDCTYTAFQTEVLSFLVDGIRIDHVYVNEGDLVKQGDLLADLEMDNIYDQIEERTDNSNLLNLKITNEKELKSLVLSSQNKLIALDGYNMQLDSEYESQITGYYTSIKSLEDELYIEEKRLNQLKEEVSDRQIVAGIDGIISYVSSYNDGELSNKETTMIKIYDPDTMVFVADDKYSEFFTLGQEYTVDVSGTEYKVVVSSPEDLFFHDSDKEGKIYLKLTEADMRLQNSNQGKITFIINELKNIVYLPAAAVHKEDGKAFVYVEDEGGFKSMKEIEVGKTVDKKVEIKSGLNQGDKVILK